MRLLALALSALLTGCTTLPAITTKQYPPSALLEDCRTGPLGFKTEAELTESTLRLAAALKLCNIDKANLREWAKP